MGIVTAPSVSLEGRSLWIVQSLPVEPWQVLRAKLRLHLLCVGAPALVSAVLLAAALRLGAVQAVLLMLRCGLYPLARRAILIRRRQNQLACALAESAI